MSEKRAKSKTTLEKNLYKLLTNSTYGSQRSLLNTRMAKFTLPYDIALTVYNGLSDTNLDNGYTYSNHVIAIFFYQPANVHFVYTPFFNSNGFKGFIDKSKAYIYTIQ